ncbi:hypothetical protein [Novosphingobium olei]|uniref:Uncharacterized protein n=1 Tax=Novosphingobium olei TaxID=2728851 RepID=A0A7Y0BPN7_9SPHN|nr:hypothetical protein [Novosphingobium olei]NML94173.1 hypothetical protein [Novosphingobium olei]
MTAGLAAIAAIGLLTASITLMAWGNSDQFHWQPMDPRAPRCEFDCEPMGFGKVLVAISFASFCGAVVSAVIAIWKLIR